MSIDTDSVCCFMQKQIESVFSLTDNNLRKVVFTILNNQPKKDPIRNYFPLPNEIFCLGLTAGEIAVYSYLMFRENRVTYECWPSYSTIGSAVHMSDNTVREYVDLLRQKRLIDTDHTKVRWQSGETRNGTLLYHVRPIHEAIDYYQEMQLRLAQKQAAAKRAQERLEAYEKKHPRNNSATTEEQES